MRANQPFVFYTPHLRRKSTMRRCFYHTDLYKMQYFTIFQDKFHSFNIQDHRSTRGLLVTQFKKFPKSPIRPTGSNFWQAPNLQRNFKRVTLQRDRSVHTSANLIFHFSTKNGKRNYYLSLSHLHISKYRKKEKKRKWSGKSIIFSFF